MYDNIAEGHRFLMKHWRSEADQIYLFGFSRGAFTARAIAGMVNLFGVVRPEYDALVPTLVHIYFAPSAESPSGPVQRVTRWAHRRALQRDALPDPSAPAHARRAAPIHESSDGSRHALAEQVRQRFAGPGRADAWVHWVGVWDTVESVGLPGPLSRVNPTPPVITGKRYRHVRHALSLDEHRWPFLPRLYEGAGDIGNSGDPTAQTLRQRWYPGVHCDAGGSYPRDECAISDLALAWMMDEAADELGLVRVPGPAPGTVEAWRHDPLWDNPFWALAGMTVRNMQPSPRSHAPRRRPHKGFHAIPADVASLQPIRSVWERRRSARSLLIALVVGLLCLVASGLCLLPTDAVVLRDPGTLLRAMQATSGYAGAQLAALWGAGVLADGHQPWASCSDGVQPGWAMGWDLLFIACWGYLVARIASRGFAWLVGPRTVESGRLHWTWQWLGFAPMLAVLGGVAENLSLWAALALHAAGTDVLASAALWLGGVAAAGKLAGLVGCLCWGLLRLCIMVVPRRLRE